MGKQQGVTHIYDACSISLASCSRHGVGDSSCGYVSESNILVSNHGLLIVFYIFFANQLKQSLNEQKPTP